MGLKYCTQCNTDKDTTEFFKDRSREDGFQNRCKSCDTKNRNPEKKAAKDRRAALKKKYGVTMDGLAAMWAQQGGVCAICKEALVLDLGARGYAVDHNHHTGEIRGLLCCSCNSGLGFFRDSIKNIQSAVRYLQSKGSYGGCQ